MSHTAQYVSSLQGVNQELFRKAFEIVAKKYNGSVTNSIKDYYGHTVNEHNGKKIVFAITTSRLSKGLGVTLDDNNNPSFVALVDQGNSAIETMRVELEFTYKALAIAQALRLAGYEGSQASIADDMILFEGMKG